MTKWEAAEGRDAKQVLTWILKDSGRNSQFLWFSASLAIQGRTSGKVGTAFEMIEFKCATLNWLLNTTLHDVTHTNWSVGPFFCCNSKGSRLFVLVQRLSWFAAKFAAKSDSDFWIWSVDLYDRLWVRKIGIFRCSDKPPKRLPTWLNNMTARVLVIRRPGTAVVFASNTL